VRDLFKKQNRAIEIVVKDSQSSSARASDVAADLILRDKVSLVLVGAAPETDNPVSDQCELNEVPCVSTVSPWQPWFFARGGKPEKPFKWTYHFFWGLEDAIAAFIGMWRQLETNRIVGGVFANDADANAWGEALPPELRRNGFRFFDPGRFQTLTDNFSAHITAFKSAGADIITGNMIPPDFTTFWTQARQQGLKPKIATVGKPCSFPHLSRRSEQQETNCRRRSGGLRIILSSRRCRARAPRSWPRPILTRPVGNGRNRSAIFMRFSKWPPTS
jgi:branched-chain amino acid transport system substrate-binding protein